MDFHGGSILIYRGCRSMDKNILDIVYELKESGNVPRAYDNKYSQEIFSKGWKEALDEILGQLLINNI